MMSQDLTDKIDYPKQTSEWGRNLIDILNSQFERFELRFDNVNDNIQQLKNNMNEQFEDLKKDINKVQIVAQTALSLSEQNKKDIIDMCSELDDAKKEMAEIQSQLTDSNCEMKYCKHSCNELIAENKSLKLHTNKLDNYSRRMNIIIRGIDDSKEETNDQCVHKVYDFMKNQLKLDNGTLDRIKFAGCHRLSVSTNRNRREHHQQMKRPIIVQFFNSADKATVWGAKFHISDSGVSISENFSADTEYNRNKLYMLYKKAKSMDRYKQKVHLVGDVLILDGKRYGVDELHILPVELSPRQFSERINDAFHIFGGIHSASTPFSNWFRCKIQYEGYTFKSVEQAYQYAKARYVDDSDSADKLMYTVDPAKAKKIRSKVIGLNGINWETDKFAIMEDLVRMKFTQCDHMKAELLKTGSKTMVESGRDVHYACGLSIVHKDIFNTAKWSGKNNLGKILGAVRDAICA